MRPAKHSSDRFDYTINLQQFNLVRILSTTGYLAVSYLHGRHAGSQLAAATFPLTQGQSPITDWWLSVKSAMYRRVSPRIASHRFNILTNLDNCFHLQLKCRCMRRTRLPMGAGWEWQWRGKAVKISHQLKLKLFLDDGQGRGRQWHWQWQLCSSSNNCNGKGTGKGTHLSAVHASISRLPSFLLFCVLCQIKKEIKMNIFLGLWVRK